MFSHEVYACLLILFEMLMCMHVVLESDNDMFVLFLLLLFFNWSFVLLLLPPSSIFCSFLSSKDLLD